MGGGGAAVFYTLRFVALFVLICVWLPRDGKLYASLLVVPLFLVFLFSRGNFDTIGVMKDVLFFCCLHGLNQWCVVNCIDGTITSCVVCLFLSLFFFFFSFCPCFVFAHSRLFFFFFAVITCIESEDIMGDLFFFCVAILWTAVTLFT